MCTNPTPTSEAGLIELHSATCAEITRYRDREWHNQGIFTAAIIGILGFILVNPTPTKNAAHIFDAALALLAVGNIWFTLFAHHSLTEQRNILASLRLLLQFHDTSADGKPILPPDWKRSPASFKDGWLRGVLSHLIWFFAVDAWLVYEGIRLLHST
jgi:hypothetical protein